MKKYLVGVISLFLAANSGMAEAGGSGTRGGDGVRIDGQLYLSDLVEAGIEKTPYIPNVKIRPAFAATVAYSFPNQSKEFQDLLAQKLSHLETVSPAFAAAMNRALEVMTFNFNSETCPNIKDEGRMLVTDEPYVQLALRDQLNVMICDLWGELIPSNQVALILHELIYSYSHFLKDEDGISRQQSVPTRVLNAALFNALIFNRPNRLEVLRGTAQEKSSLALTFQYPDLDSSLRGKPFDASFYSYGIMRFSNGFGKGYKKKKEGGFALGVGTYKVEQKGEYESHSTIATWTANESSASVKSKHEKVCDRGYDGYTSIGLRFEVPYVQIMQGGLRLTMETSDPIFVVHYDFKFFGMDERYNECMNFLGSARSYAQSFPAH